jgi:hypothetical protein
MGIKRFITKLVGSWDIAKKLASNRRVIGTGFPKPENVGGKRGKHSKKHPVNPRSH